MKSRGVTLREMLVLEPSERCAIRCPGFNSIPESLIQADVHRGCNLSIKRGPDLRYAIKCPGANSILQIAFGKRYHIPSTLR